MKEMTGFSDTVKRSVFDDIHTISMQKYGGKPVSSGSL